MSEVLVKVKGVPASELTTPKPPGIVLVIDLIIVIPLPFAPVAPVAPIVPEVVTKVPVAPTIVLNALKVIPGIVQSNLIISIDVSVGISITL